MPGTEKVLDKGGRTREWHVWANTVPALPGLPVPQGASLSKLSSELSPPLAANPSSRGPRPAQTQEQSPLVKINAMARKQLGLASQGSTVSQQQHAHPLVCKILRRCCSQMPEPSQSQLELLNLQPPCSGAPVGSPPGLQPDPPVGGAEKGVQVKDPTK